MKNSLFFIFVFFGQLLLAQSFTEVHQPFFLSGVRSSSVAFADVDGDGDHDLLITGQNDSYQPTAKLYTNDGGNFTEAADIPLDGVEYSSVAFSDVDGNGDNDVLITGRNGTGEPIAKLYTNDEGTFTEATGTPFDGVSSGSVVFSDVDGDGDNDVLITGRNGAGESIAKLYTNDEGNFTEVMGTPFDGVLSGSVAFLDVDGDVDHDVLITGAKGGGEPIAKLYINDGGSFTEVMDTPFEGVRSGSSVAFSDVDGDGDNDVLITGENGSFEQTAKLYTNDGGSFTEVMDTPFEGVRSGSVAFSDVDGDGDNDVLITGQNSSFEPITKVYTNDEGSFTEVTGTPFEGVRSGSVAFSDVDGDGDNDVLITGANRYAESITQLYTNDEGSFTQAAPPLFEGVSSGSIAFSDVDGDGDNDVLITGVNSSYEPIAKLFPNAGGSLFEGADVSFEGVASGSVAFSDVDGDGDNDVLITGDNGSFGIAKLYTNTGGTFTEVMGTPFAGVRYGSVAFSDVDGDGDEDLLITGENGPEGPISKLYTNVEGSFTEVGNTLFDGVRHGSVAFSDVDGDGDNDVLITGENGSGERIAKLYTNAGGSFTEAAGTPFEGVDISSVAFSDVDGDGDQDVLITGDQGFPAPFAKLYTNTGGIFTETEVTFFEGVRHGSVAFSDVDGDGDNDVLITGQNRSYLPISKLYINDGGGFTEVTGTPFDRVQYSSVTFSDVDGDGDEDVLITGRNDSNKPISKLYTNDNLTSSREYLVNENRFEFTLYPNPAKADNLNIRYHAVGSGLVTIKVFDLYGRPLRQQQQGAVVGQQTFSVDITSLKKGSYFIQLDDGKVRGVRKFLIQ